MISRGYVHYQQTLRETKSQSAKFRIRWSKVPRFFGAPKLSYGHFPHRAGHGRGKFSSRKTPKMAINRDFLGLRALSANSARDKIAEREIPHPMVKIAALFWGPQTELWPFSSPGRPRPGEVFKPKNTQNGNKSRFPGATCIISKLCERQNRRARNSASDRQKCRAFLGPPN